jgi:anti-sigma B factor antagonist
MQVTTQQHGAVTVIKPEGPLVEAESAPLRQQLKEVRRTSLGRFVLDLSATPFVDSKGLELLYECGRDMGDSGQVMRLCSVNETVREVLELTELSSVFEHYDDVNSAVRSFL